MKTNNKLLALFEGKAINNNCISCAYFPIDNACLWCDEEEKSKSNPSYATNPADRERLLQYLMGEGEMWGEFGEWMWCIWHDDRSTPDDAMKYLLSPIDGIPRWLLLLQEWLQLEETVDRFGWKTEVFHDVDGIAECKVLTEWARLVQDEKEG